MSGHKVVPFLEKNKDVFVHGSTVSRHKQAFVDGRKTIPTDGRTELVLCAAATLKLWQGNAKQLPPPPAAKAGDAPSTSPQPQPAPPRPQLVWRQPHYMIKSVVPLSTKTTAFAFGFAVLYFAPNKESTPKPAVDLTEFASSLRKQSSFITTENSLDLITPPVRVREFRCASEYDQEDWCLAYHATLFNYWHERLEQSVILAPEVFQYQTFAVDVSKQPLVDSVAPHSAMKAPLGQVALSTERIYWLPRHDQAHLERDHPTRVVAFPVAALQEIVVYVSRGYRMEMQFAGGAPNASWNIACFTSEEGAQLIVEIQRIWDLSRKDDTFPFRCVA
jgi:hypothetical protein